MSQLDDAVVAHVPSLEELLDFEASAPQPALAKTRAIRETFGVSLVRYTQLLTKVLDREEAFTYSPVLVARLRRLRDERRALRFAHPEPAPTRPDPRQRTLPTRPHREGAQVTPSPQDVSSEDQLSGEDYKQLGMNMVSAFTDEAWADRVDEAIASLARTRDAGGLLVHFTAEDVRRIAGDPPDHPNAFGARFYKAAHRKVILKVGYRQSDRPSLHRHPIAVWVGSEGSVTA